MGHDHLPPEIDLAVRSFRGDSALCRATTHACIRRYKRALRPVLFAAIGLTLDADATTRSPPAPSHRAGARYRVSVWYKTNGPRARLSGVATS